MSELTFDDFRRQLQQLAKLGSISEFVRVGLGVSINDIQREFRQIQAIIDSMTYSERSCSIPLDGARRQRVATGAGVGIACVERFVDDFLKLKKMPWSTSIHILKPKDDEAFRLFTDDPEYRSSDTAEPT